MEFFHPAMWHVVWDDMLLNSPKRPPYWNSASGFDFDHITAVDLSFCTSLQNFIQVGPSFFLSFFLIWGDTCFLRMPALRPASQAGPMRNPREGTSV